MMSRAELLKLHRMAKELQRREQRNRITTYFDTPEIRLHTRNKWNFSASAPPSMKSRYSGGYRTGKTVVGGCQDVYHLTGLYPDWWKQTIQHTHLTVGRPGPPLKRSADYEEVL